MKCERKAFSIHFHEILLLGMLIKNQELKMALTITFKRVKKAFLSCGILWNMKMY